ncbi:methionyl-tRNA formyltransferase [Ferruginibacter sp.]|uniref:methionyl-tRNA formyltransferase n=1 Tax=Ferruginibacter sp. TaxID=1940288 RepID=UPI0019B22B98|nr:formyltransferase family protein [Ferruginibacter sp.]MBC7627987.1 hypothetical protein [Ferruginibacter sp.]
MKFVFFGGKEIGSYILRNLLNDDIIPAAIISYQDIIAPEVLLIAKGKGIPVLQLRNFKNSIFEIIQFIQKLDADSYVSVSFPFILPKEILSLVKTPINIHTGAIPKYRGYHPISAALLNDEPFQGTTVHLMAEEVDAGSVLLQDFVEVKNTDDINSIKEKLINLSNSLLITVLNQLRTNTLYPKKQIGEIIWAPKRLPEDSKIDFNNKTRYLHNFVRALSDPYPNAYCFLKDEKIRIKSSLSGNVNGEVLNKTIDGKYIIATADGVLIVECDRLLQIGDILN